MVTGILSWQNENGRTQYPLQNNVAVQDDLIVDASFIQFDGNVPTLVSILVSSTDFQVTIKFDRNTITAQFLKSDYQTGIRHLAIYDNVNGVSKRYQGTLTFGDGADYLWNNRSNELITYGVQFLPSTVRTIPSDDALYSLNGRFGDIELAGGDSAIFFDIDPASNWITFNAVQNFKVPSDPVIALKQVNLVTPINNRIFIGSNDVIHVDNGADGSLNFSLVSNNTAVTPIVTTLAN